MDAILRSFGPILRIKDEQLATRGFLFVVYKEISDAEKVRETLSSFDERVKIFESQKKKLLDEGQSSVYAPLPSYYIRWPKKDPHLKEAVEQVESSSSSDEETPVGADGWQAKKSKKAVELEAKVREEKKQMKKEAKEKAKKKQLKEEMKKARKERRAKINAKIQRKALARAAKGKTKKTNNEISEKTKYYPINFFSFSTSNPNL